MINALRQTKAIFVDAYRELNAKKLFWVTMILSGLVVLVIAAVGYGPEGVTIFGLSTPFPINTDVLSAETFYKMLFSSLGITIWLTWAATILALISTAQIIPDFVASGGIELWLVRPIGRVRLLLTKYLTGLLFVGLQVAVFSVAGFLVIGLRAGAWEPGVFLAIPIVVVFFSYLFSVQFLVGLITRSTIASLLTALLFWALLFAFNLTDSILLTTKINNELRQEAYENRIERQQENATVMIRQAWRQDGLADADTREPTEAEFDEQNPRIAENREELADLRESHKTISLWYRGIFAAKTVLPKTGETIELLNRYTIDRGEIDELAESFADDEDQSPTPSTNWSDQRFQQETNRRAATELESRPLWWVLGTSLGFEAVILGISCLVMVKRDF